MIVVANGGYRTGSTFVYMVAMEILKAVGFELETGIRYHEELISTRYSKSAVFKSHDWMPPKDTQIFTIYTRRNDLDVYASFKKQEPYKKTDINVIANLKLEKTRRQTMLWRPCLTLDYEDFFDNEQWVVYKICQYLDCWKASVPKIAEKLNSKNLKSMTDAMKVDDIWHPHHISDDPRPGNFIDVLDAETIEKVTREVNLS